MYKQCKLLLVFLSWCFCFALPARAQPPVDAFAHLDAMHDVAISATGKYLAWLDGDIVVTYDMATGEQHFLKGGVNHPVSLNWVNDDYLIAGFRNQYDNPYWDQSHDFYAYMVLSPKAEYLRPLFAAANKNKPNESGALVMVVNGSNPIAIVEAEDKKKVTRENSDDNRRITLFKVDLKTGQQTAIENGMPKTAGWSLDSKGNPRVRIDVGKFAVNYGILRSDVYVKLTPDSPYTLFEYPAKEGVIASAFEFSESDNAVFWKEYDRKANHSQMWSKNLATGEIKLETEVDGKSLGVIIDSDTGNRLGFMSYFDKLKIDWTSPFYIKTFTALHKALPGLELSVEDATTDDSLMVINAESPSHPPIHYLYNTKSGTLDIIGESYPDLADAELGETEFVTYKAEDGLDIHAYVTKRKDLKLPAPAIVMVHGGPAARDYYGFDWWAQFLVNRGYVVIQPQYRGSQGFGDNFQKAGNGQWGRKMNTDLVDGVNYLVAQGVIDPKKVCVHGWSYGGYATMASMTLSPDVWACGIEGAGVSDPIKMINWVGIVRGQDRAGEENSSVEYWKSLMGDPRLDSAKMHEITPTDHAEAMKAPMLLFHGDKDIVVDPNQSRFMWEAMQKAGKTGKLVMLPGEDHHLTLAKSRLVFLTEMEAFLKEHNPSEYNHN